MLTPAINFRLFGFFLNGINDTGNKFFVVDTAEQLITGVVDTSNKH